MTPLLKRSNHLCRRLIIAASAFGILVAHAAFGSLQAISPAALQLLPAQWKADRLWPNLDTEQASAAKPIAGYACIYSSRDWHRFTMAYGAAQHRLLYELDSARNAFAKTLLAAAAKTHRAGYCRLLCLRAFAVTFQHSSGSALAASALKLYMHCVPMAQIGNPVEIAPIWTMSHELAWLGATPLPLRERMAVVAEKANVQLSVDLLNSGQYQAAQAVVAMLPIHETNRVRRNAVLMGQMGTVRALTRQSVAEINFIGRKLSVAGQNQQAAMYVMLHAAFVHPQLPLVRRLMRRWPHTDVYRLGDLLLSHQPTPMQRYQRAELIIKACHGLSRGILRDRAFYAALRDLLAFRRAPSTRWNRVHRALAKITIAHLIERYAMASPHADALAPLIGTPSASSVPHVAAPVAAPAADHPAHTTS